MQVFLMEPIDATHRGMCVMLKGISLPWQRACNFFFLFVLEIESPYISYITNKKRGCYE